MGGAVAGVASHPPCQMTVDDVIVGLMLGALVVVLCFL